MLGLPVTLIPATSVLELICTEHEQACRAAKGHPDQARLVQQAGFKLCQALRRLDLFSLSLEDAGYALLIVRAFAGRTEAAAALDVLLQILKEESHALGAKHAATVAEALATIQADWTGKPMDDDPALAGMSVAESLLMRLVEQLEQTVKSLAALDAEVSRLAQGPGAFGPARQKSDIAGNPGGPTNPTHAAWDKLWASVAAASDFPRHFPAPDGRNDEGKASPDLPAKPVRPPHRRK